MSALKDSRGDGGMSECPVHAQMTHDHERRMDELKETGDKAFGSIEEFKKDCQEARKDCQSEIWKGINARPRQSSLMWLAGIGLTIVIIVFGLFSRSISEGITHLKETDIRIEKNMAQSKKDLAVWQEKFETQYNRVESTLNAVEKKLK